MPRVCHTSQRAPHAYTLTELDEKCMTQWCDDVWLTQRWTVHIASAHGKRTRMSYECVVRVAYSFSSYRIFITPSCFNTYADLCRWKEWAGNFIHTWQKVHPRKADFWTNRNLHSFIMSYMKDELFRKLIAYVPRITAFSVSTDWLWSSSSPAQCPHTDEQIWKFQWKKIYSYRFSESVCATEITSYGTLNDWFTCGTAKPNRMQRLINREIKKNYPIEFVPRLLVPLWPSSLIPLFCCDECLLARVWDIVPFTIGLCRDTVVK